MSRLQQALFEYVCKQSIIHVLSKCKTITTTTAAEATPHVHLSRMTNTCTGVLWIECFTNWTLNPLTTWWIESDRCLITEQYCMPLTSPITISFTKCSGGVDAVAGAEERSSSAVAAFWCFQCCTLSALHGLQSLCTLPAGTRVNFPHSLHGCYKNKNRANR